MYFLFMALYIYNPPSYLLVLSTPMCRRCFQCFEGSRSCFRQFLSLPVSTLPSVSEFVPLFREVCDDGADGFALGIGGFSLKVTAEVADAATQEGIQIVTSAPWLEKTFCGKSQVLIPIRWVVYLGIHYLTIQLLIKKYHKDFN